VSSVINKTVNIDTARIPFSEVNQERRLMALDSLANLVLQFTKNQSLEDIVMMFLWTISGQLSTPNTFAVIRTMTGDESGLLSLATGSFAAQNHIKNIAWTSDFFDHFLDRPGVHEIDGLIRRSSIGSLATELKAIDVGLICPLTHGTQISGIIGLGSRVGNKQFTEQDAAYIFTFANTLTPFIVNALQFDEISYLHAWHAEIINTLDQGVLVFGSDLRLKSVNRAALAMLAHYNVHSLEAKSLISAPMDTVFPDSVFSGWADKIIRLCKEGAFGSLDNQIIRHGQAERVFNLKTAFMHMVNHDNRDLIVTIEDVTDKVLTEGRLFELNRLADKAVMATSIAHEFNNYVGMIMGSVQLASLAFEAGDKDKLSRNLSQLEEAALRMRTYTNGLTEFGRIGASKQISSINDVVSEVLSFARVQKRFSRIIVTQDLDPLIPNIEFDRDHVAQLLLNFTNNSAEAIRQAHRSDGAVRVATKLLDNSIILSIADNGVGMTPDIHEKLFRGRATTSREGHGFGWHTCSQIAKAHNAEIRIQSSEADGTKIEVIFPASSPFKRQCASQRPADSSHQD
jgi:signal transduction histidine kinase